MGGALTPKGFDPQPYIQRMTGLWDASKHIFAILRAKDESPYIGLFPTIMEVDRGFLEGKYPSCMLVGEKVGGVKVGAELSQPGKR